MANHNLVHRPSNTSTSPLIIPENDDSKGKSIVFSFNFTWPFSIPSTPESAALRIIRNLGIFTMYYAQFIWIVLFISLIPKRKVSLIYLVIMKEITIMYLMLLHALPNCVLIHKIVDKRVVMVLLSLVTVVEMILTRAAIHLLGCLAGTIPVILMHAVFWRSEEAAGGGDGGDGELVHLFDDKDCRGDAKPLDLV